MMPCLGVLNDQSAPLKAHFTILWMGMWHLLAFMLQMVSSNQLSIQHQAGPWTLYTVRKLHEQCLQGTYLSGLVGSRLHALTILRIGRCSQSAEVRDRPWIDTDLHAVLCCFQCRSLSSRCCRLLTSLMLIVIRVESQGLPQILCNLCFTGHAGARRLSA